MALETESRLREEMNAHNPRKVYGLLAGIIAYLILYYVTPLPAGMEPEALQVSAVLALMMIWWLSEAVPLAVTALVPVVLFPFTGVMDIKAATSAYGNPVIFLFLGGFILAIAMERWGLHMRIALNIVRVIGTSANTVIAGFMIATAFLSMWISNTATVVMMIPICLSVIRLLMRDEGGQNTAGVNNFATAMMLGLAFAASIGGVGTLIGTPPNAVFAGYVRTAYDIEVGFAQWMMLAMPIVIMMLAACWLVLINIYPNRMGRIAGAEKIIDDELAKLGRWSYGEKAVAVIFSLTAFLWVFRPLVTAIFGIELNDAGIAVMGAIALFLVPVSLKNGVMLLTWKEAEKLPWGILLLFGGGLCLASAVKTSKLADWVGGRIEAVVDVPELVLILIIAGVVKILTEFMSNVATITTFLPIIAALAAAFGYAPLDLMIPATMSASFAFMTPVATPPNAVVFGSGYIRTRQMAYAGMWMNIIAMFISPIFCYWFIRYAFTT